MIKEGIHVMSDEYYHADPCSVPSLSRSTIKDLIFKTPQHAWQNHPKLNPEYKNEEKTAYDIGSAAHALLLEGIDKAVIIDAEDWRTKAAKESRDIARASGMYPLLNCQYEDVYKMVVTAKAYLRTCELKVKDIQNDGDSEMSCIWEEDGIWFRTRLDWISKEQDLIIDYKTTSQSADPSDFDRTILSSGLDIQDALYRRGIEWITGKRPKFVFLIQETTQPYLCSLLELTYVYQEMGAEKIEKAAKIWEKCLKENNWPGYSNKVYSLSPPTWVLQRWEERKEMDNVRV